MECSTDGCLDDAEVACYCNSSSIQLCSDHYTDHLRLAVDHKPRPFHEKANKKVIERVRWKFDSELQFYSNLKKAVEENSLELIACINEQSRIVLEEIRLAETDILEMLNILELGNIVPEYLHKSYKILKDCGVSKHCFDLSKLLKMIQEYYSLYKLKQSEYKYDFNVGKGLGYMMTDKYSSFEVDDRYFMIGTKIGDIFLYNKNDLKQERVLLGHTQIITSLISRGNRLISESYDESIIVWSLENFTKLLKLKNVVIIHRDLIVGKNFFLCGMSQKLCIIRITDLKVEIIARQKKNERCNSLAINQDDSFGVAGYNDKAIIWDICRGSVHRIIPICSEMIQFISNDTILNLEQKKLTIFKLFDEHFERIINTNQKGCCQLTISRDKKHFATRSAVDSM